MSGVENSIPPIASGKLLPWYLCLMYVYAFGEKHFCMFNANKVFVLYLYFRIQQHRVFSHVASFFLHVTVLLPMQILVFEALLVIHVN